MVCETTGSGEKTDGHVTMGRDCAWAFPCQAMPGLQRQRASILGFQFPALWCRSSCYLSHYWSMRCSPSTCVKTHYDTFGGSNLSPGQKFRMGSLAGPKPSCVWAGRAAFLLRASGCHKSLVVSSCWGFPGPCMEHVPFRTCHSVSASSHADMRLGSQPRQVLYLQRLMQLNWVFLGKARIISLSQGWLIRNWLYL